MDDVTGVPYTLGLLGLRPEQDADQDFRFELFCNSRPPEWQMVALDPNLFRHIMRQQFHAQAMSYRAQFPQARFDIIELDGESVGRIVVDRPGSLIRVVDIAVVPTWRGRGIGASVITALFGDARSSGIPVRLAVASSNDPSMRLYLRLGFEVVATAEMYVEMEWRAART